MCHIMLYLSEDVNHWAVYTSNMMIDNYEELLLRLWFTKLFPPVSFSLFCSYVREWLGSMVSLGVFDFDENKETYFFPQSRHDMFTLKGGIKNMACFAEGYLIAGRCYKDVMNCFPKDGPLGNYMTFYRNITTTRYRWQWFQRRRVTDL